MSNATRDENSVPVLLATSSVDGTPVPVYADPTTHRLLVDVDSIGFTMTGATSISTPLDSTTYYFGSSGFTGSTSAGYYRFRIPVDCTLQTVTIENYYSGTQPSTETSTINMKVNGGTNIEITPNFHNEINALTFIINCVGSNFDLSANSYIEFNWVTPAWATNPGTSSILKTTLYFVKR